MRRGFSLIQLVFLAVIVVFIFKVAIPKFSGVKNDALIMAAFSDLDRAINDIATYYYKYGKFGTISDMTYVLNFDDTNTPLKDGSVVNFVVGKAKSSGGSYCTQMTLQNAGTNYKFKFDDTTDVSPICVEFRESQRYKTLLVSGASLKFN